MTADHVVSTSRAGSTFGAVKAENSRLLRDDVARRRTVYRGLPEVVTLNHSDICNLRCIMCQRSLGQGKHRLDERVLDHLANELFPTARKVVLTTAGGDPLAVDFDFLLERARRFEVRIDAVTNGLLLSRDVYERARGTLDHLNVSLDSHLPHIYERIRAGSSFARVWRNLEEIAAERRRAPDGVLFSVSAVVMKSNLPHLADFVRAVATLQPDGVVFQRLQHGEKATPEEEPTVAFSPAEIEQFFAAAERTARELGINLFLSEFRRPNILPAPPRPKVPTTIEGQGVCWFLAQNFTVMYTGEVFPCCIPTDLCLGDVHYQDPVDIWNGEPFRRLREQHLTRSGNLFCSGCLHAPHLPAASDDERLPAERERRAKAFEAESELRRPIVALRTRPTWAPDLPHFLACDGVFADDPRPIRIASRRETIEAAAVTPQGEILTVRAGALEWRNVDGDVRRTLDLRASAGTVRAKSVHPVPDGAVLVGFEERGLFRVDGEAIRCVLELSDPRSFVRDCGIATARDGSIWVGEYGVFPGARCAWLHRSTDGGRSFERVTRFTEARHIHRVLASSDGRVLVTTGDLAAERRLYASDGHGGFECVAPAWSGFIAACEKGRDLHFGTDLQDRNGLVVFRGGLAGPPEFRPLPTALDLKVRSIVALADGTLLALLGMDENLGRFREGRRPALLASRDDGRRWTVVHRFAADWSDEADGLVPLGGMRAWAIGGATHHVVDLDAAN